MYFLQRAEHSFLVRSVFGGWVCRPLTVWEMSPSFILLPKAQAEDLSSAGYILYLRQRGACSFTPGLTPDAYRELALQRSQSGAAGGQLVRKPDHGSPFFLKSLVNDFIHSFKHICHVLPVCVVQDTGTSG